MQPNQLGQPTPQQPNNYPQQPSPANGNFYVQPNHQSQPQTQYQQNTQNQYSQIPNPYQTPINQPQNPQFQNAPYQQTQYPYSPQPQQPTQVANQPQNSPHQVASWYSPAKKEPDNKPGSIDSYLNTAKPSSNSANVPGQIINGQYAVDYLGGIAPDQPIDSVTIGNKTSSKKTFFIGIGIIGAGILTAMLMLFTPNNKGVSNLNESSLFSSMVSTSEITKTAGRKIKSSKLRAINSSLNSQLLGSITEMADPLAKSGIDSKKLEATAKKPTAKESERIQTLENARLNATYDRAYSREITYRLDTMLVTLNRIDKINTRASMREFTKNTRTKLESIKKALDEVSNSI